MAPLYNKALILGATSGIGAALAAKLVETGTKVVGVGRRQNLLDELVKKNGAENTSAIRFDVTDLAGIPAFVASVTKDHPDIDCVVVNSGIQRGFDFARPETVDLAELDLELTTNYSSAVHITVAFLPHLKAQPTAHIVYVSASLGLIPTLVSTANYNASKAALHCFIMAVRQQLKDAGQTSVRMVEVFPPAVQTELHDEKHQPHLVNGGAIGMPLDIYTDKMYQGLIQGDDQFAIGPAEALLKDGGWEAERQKLFQTQHVIIRESMSKFLKDK